MAEPSKAELSELLGQLQSKLQTVEAITAAHEKELEKVKTYMTIITFLKWITGITGALVVAGILSFFWTWVNALADIRYHKEAIIELKDRLEKTTERHAEVVKLILERFPRVPVSTLVWEGRLMKITFTEIVIQAQTPEKGEKTFKLRTGTRFLLGGKTVKPVELLAGMSVVVVEGEKGEAVAVEAARP